MFSNIFIIIWALLGLSVLSYNEHTVNEYSDIYPTSQLYYSCKLYLVKISCLTPNNYKPRGNIHVWFGIITSCHHWFRLWILACMAPNHYLKNADLLSLIPFGTKLSEIRIKIFNFSSTEFFINLIDLKILSINASWSTLVQVMVCCLVVPRHYLYRCWLLISHQGSHEECQNCCHGAAFGN